MDESDWWLRVVGNELSVPAMLPRCNYYNLKNQPGFHDVIIIEELEDQPNNY